MEGQKKIAIVDDDASVRKALRRLMKTAGYDAIAFKSAEVFLESEAKDHSNCLILDVHLPGMSGLELLAKLTQAGSPCPIVFISAFDDESAREQAINRGAISFLPKPLDGEVLLEVIGNAVRTQP